MICVRSHCGDRIQTLICWAPKGFLLGHMLLISPQFLPVLNLPDASNGVCYLDEEAINTSKGYFSLLAKWWLAHLSYSFILKANYLSTYFKCAKSTQSELYWQIIRWGTVSIYMLVTSAYGSEQMSFSYSDDLNSHPRMTWEAVLTFLGPHLAQGNEPGQANVIPHTF